MPGKRNWLKKITRWIFDAPNERTSKKASNRAIFFQLPWTSTEFEQVVGRLDRDGTEFDSIDVFLPITDINLPNGEQWSWCRSKLDRINSKRDIAKAAVDGEVPDAASMISPSEASKYWVNWLERLNKEMQETT